MLAGLDKIRKTEMIQYEETFSNLDKSVEKIFQDIKYWYYIRELQSLTNLQENYNQQIYQKILHIMQWVIYMIKTLKQFNHLKGPIAYPGSIELTTSEGIKDVKKGFFEVDISGKRGNTKVD